MRIVCLILCLLSLSACSLVRQAEKPRASQTAPSILAPAKRAGALDDEAQLRYSELYHAGLLARMGQNFDAAFELFRAAAEINPQSAETAYELAMLYQDVASQDSTYLFHLSDSLLQVSVRLAPANKHYKIALIDSYERQGRFAESAAQARLVADAYPTADNFVRLERLCELCDDYEGTLYALNRLENIEGKSLDISLSKFWIYQQLGREAEGYKAMEDLCRAFPTELRYRVEMGELYFAGGHEDMALATYRDVLTLDPDNDAAQYAMLEYYLDKEDEQAFNSLLNTYLLNPRAATRERQKLLDGFILENGAQSEAASTLMHTVLFSERPPRELVATCAKYLGKNEVPAPSLKPLYNRVLEIAPSYNAVRRQALMLAAHEGDQDAVLNICREAHLYAPADPDYYFYEGELLYMQGQTRRALDVLDDGVERADATSPRALVSRLYTLRAEILIETEEPEEAYAAYDSALVYDPGNPEVLANYAILLTEQDEHIEKALDLSRHAVDAEPHDPLYLDTYAYALALNERYADARVMADSALSQAALRPEYDEDPEYGRMLDHAGDIYFNLGLTDEAVNLWQRALPLTETQEIKNEIQRKIRRRKI